VALVAIRRVEHAYELRLVIISFMFVRGEVKAVHDCDCVSSSSQDRTYVTEEGIGWLAVWLTPRL